jgi:hypothetical protein
LIVLDNYSHIGFKYINARPSIRPKRELLQVYSFFSVTLPAQCGIPK